ncbi:hypothetical protein OC844_005824 [Tilletia horrida]|nr:hypothetical protein OC844_005824 [Tilletia horrida]
MIFVQPEHASLYALTRGAQLYFPPKPRFERSPELEKSLAAIRLAHEQAEYERMTSILNPSQRKRSLFSLAEPPRSHASDSLHPSAPVLTVQKLTPEQEAEEWAEANKQISAVINIVISMAAVATAAWWAAGSANVLWVELQASKTLVCMALAIIVGVAETVMYARYWRVATQQAATRSSKMSGFDAGKPPAVLSFAADKATSKTKS